jgi:alcohol dehydrogenase YqhD (iron-dependent ADH family)
MLRYRLNLKTELFFGKNQIENLPKILQKNNFSKILLVYGKNSIKKNGIYDALLNIFKENNIYFEELSGIEPNPKLTSVKKGAKICKEKNIEFILAVGGGSVIDASKAIAASRYYSGNPWDFFEKKATIKKALPIGVILTLSATGSEMNAGMVITNEKTGEKLDWGSTKLIPKFAILDPSYTFFVSKKQTAAGIADIMSHVFEQYFSFPNEAFLQDRFSEAILKTCIHFGKIAINNPNDEIARENIMQAATMALNGLIGAGKQGDWATHFIEHEISALKPFNPG